MAKKSQMQYFQDWQSKKEDANEELGQMFEQSKNKAVICKSKYINKIKMSNGKFRYHYQDVKQKDNFASLE